MPDGAELLPEGFDLGFGFAGDPALGFPRLDFAVALPGFEPLGRFGVSAACRRIFPLWGFLARASVRIGFD